MNITVEKQQLLKAISLTQTIVQKKTTMPILLNILLTATEEGLSVSATDLEVAVVSRIQAQVTTGGRISVHAKVINDIVRELPEGEVHLQLSEGERLEISAGKTKVRMVGQSAEGYPILSSMEVSVTQEVAASLLVEMINKTLYAVSSDETRFNLNGIYLEPCSVEGEPGVSMAATDGNRLAFIKRPCNLKIDEGVIIPRKGILELKRVLDEKGGEQVYFGVVNGLVVLETSDTKLTVQLVDGEFPDYSQVIPKEEGTELFVSSDELAHAVKRVALLSTEKTKCVLFDFAPELLRLSSSSPELGDAVEEIAVEYEGEVLRIGFDARYIHDLATSLEENQTLRVELHGELGASRFSPRSDPSYIGIIMPMRT